MLKQWTTTAAYVRSWVPRSFWHRALDLFLRFLTTLARLRYARPLLLMNGERSGGGGRGSGKRLLWLSDGDSDDDALRLAQEQDGAHGRDGMGVDTTGRAAMAGRRGLRNMGNTCFINAVLQCLAVVPGFVDRLAQQVAWTTQAVAHGDGCDHDRRAYERQRERRRQLQLAQTLVALLRGVLPPIPEESDDEEVVKDEEQEDAFTRSITNGYTEGCVETDGWMAARFECDPLWRGRVRKRPRMMAGREREREFSSESTNSRLRSFLAAASECTDLVAARAVEQEQQDAEEFFLFLLDSLHELLRSPHQQKSGDVTSTAPPPSPPPGSMTSGLIELRQLVEMEEVWVEQLKKCMVTDPATYNTTVCTCQTHSDRNAAAWCGHLSEIRWRRYLREHNSLITDVFGGQIVRGSQCCRCANLTCLHQEFRVLSLSIDSSVKSQTLGNCLSVHRDLEDLVADNRVYCGSHCQDKTNRRTQVLIQRAPELLVIQLQRFRHTHWRSSPEKVETSVEFPMGGDDHALDLTENMFMRDAHAPLGYDLQAICAHIGTALDAGHYVAYTRAPVESDAFDSDTDTVMDSDISTASMMDSDISLASMSPPSCEWLKFDDDVVSRVSENIVRAETQSTAYLLFYTRKHEQVIKDTETDHPSNESDNGMSDD